MKVDIPHEGKLKIIGKRVDRSKKRQFGNSGFFDRVTELVVRLARQNNKIILFLKDVEECEKFYTKWNTLSRKRGAL